MKRRAVLVGLAGIGAAALSGCVIVPIAKEQKIEGDQFDPEKYAEGIWASKAVPYFTGNAKPLPDVLAAIQSDFAAAGQKYGYRPATEGSPWTFVVAGTGTVGAKNTTSRAGTMTVAIEGTDAPVTLQIGPVVKGNAVRDALPFVAFQDFTNQIQFADVGKALTTLALGDISAAAAAAQPGQKLSFVGAMSLNSKSDKVLITPVSLKAA